MLDALDPSAQCLCAGGDLLGAQRQPVASRAGLVDTAGKRVVALCALSQRALGRAALVDRLLQRALDLGADGPRLGHADLGAGHFDAPRTRLVAGELPTRLQDLALQALVQLRRFRLALQRTQTGARLTLDVEGTI